jgi:hypothetical protein
VNPIVIFSIAGTLGALTLGGGEVSRARLEPNAEVVTLIRELRGQGVSIGVAIPDRFDRESVTKLLEDAGILELFDRELIREAPFTRVDRDAVRTAPFAREEGPVPAVFVSRDRFARARAGEGFRTVPHPSLVRAALLDEKLFYIRARAKQRFDPKASRPERFSWQPIVAGIELAPLDVTVESGHPVLYAVAGARAIETLSGRDEVEVEKLGDPDLPNLPERTEAVVFQISFTGAAGAAFRKRLEALPLFRKLPGGALVALDATQPEGALHPPAPDDVHGHTRALVPSSTLVADGEDVPAPEGGTLGEEAQEIISTLDGVLLERKLVPWTGAEPLPGGCTGTIKSRYLYHPDNGVAVTRLLCELAGILGSSDAHEFDFMGALRENPYGDLPGDPTRGRAGEIVIVSAHLDSTAARDGGCDLPSDIGCMAPGADDDASGIAAVLSIATVLKKLADTSGPPARTLRFVLFNAEEQFRKGSIPYAADLAGAGTDLRAVFQVDMIGTPGLQEPSASPTTTTTVPSAPPPPRFEIHGGGDLDVGTAIYSIFGAQQGMMDALEDAAALLSPGLTAQRFPIGDCGTDPGSGKSDHTSFQLLSFPGVYVCEELWTHDCPGEVRPHPTYHRKTDTLVDHAYAASIARAVAGAAWLVANP